MMKFLPIAVGPLKKYAVDRLDVGFRIVYTSALGDSSFLRSITNGSGDSEENNESKRRHFVQNRTLCRLLDFRFTYNV